jgi:isopentenyl-diphosphate delta-isomerase
MGLSCVLSYAFSFVYRAELDHELIEHELDHVFIGITDEIPLPDPEEVAEWKYISMNCVREELNATPESYTEWFKMIIPHITPQMISA